MRQSANKLPGIGRLPLADILQLSLHATYCCIVNYPRIVDQIVHTEKIAGAEEEAAKTLEYLGKVSIQHADYLARMIRELGGEPNFDFDFIDSMTNSADWCRQQLKREKFALSLYEQAKSVVEQRQIKGVWGKLSSSLLSQSKSVAVKRKTIAILDELISDERSHVRLMEKVLRELNTPLED